MRTYYRGPDAIVTGRHFVRISSPAQVFEIAEIREVRVVRGELAAAVAGAMIGGVVAAVTLTGVSWVYAGRSAGLVAAAAAIVLCLITVATVRRQTPRMWSLEADYSGTWTTLYSSADSTTFNQVKRAVCRIIETRSPDRDRYGLAAA